MDSSLVYVRPLMLKQLVAGLNTGSCCCTFPPEALTPAKHPELLLRPALEPQLLSRQGLAGLLDS